MKLLLPLTLALTVLAACSHDPAPEATPATTTTPATSATAPAEPSAKAGWEDIKSGTKEAAHGTGEAAKAAGHSVVEGSKKAGTTIKEGATEVGHAIKEGATDAGHAIKAAACPVLGNKIDKTYYTKTSKSYEGLLNGKKALSSENRECFSSEANAQEAGFKSSVK